ncbi:MAG: hypothetical protein COW30_09040 [Rhodospirillales bacterium CG15_BIG_FIL_POST_REV_8_21_14_020_66_15]|nr:MAG: hypothetical protein COW30_09040 [Rhodospirillales bacterium CG15_BIG_FIL_POST_REV_8_21_14_020_66_15]
MYRDVLLFIDGEWTKAAGGRTLPVENPATDGVTRDAARKGAMPRACGMEAVGACPNPKFVTQASI